MDYPTGISQRTWSTTASEPVTASRLRANVTAPLWLITSPPMAILAEQLTAFSMPSGSRNTVSPLDTEILDTGGGHSDATNNFRLYLPTSGWWLVRGAVPYTGATNTSQFSYLAGIQATLSGTTTNFDGALHAGPGSSSAVVMPGATELLPCTAASPVTSGDHLQLYGLQDSGSTVILAISVANGIFPWLAARWAGTLTGTAGLPVPSPASFSDTTAISGAFMNANVRDTISYLAFPPMARLSNAGGSQSVPSGADTPVTWSTASVAGTASDNYGGWSSSANPSRYTFQRAGRYYVFGQVCFPASNAGQWQCGLRVNGTTSWYGTRVSAATASNAGMIITAEKYVRVSAGDYVEVTGTQSTGSPVSLVTSSSTYSKLVVLWRGA